MLKLKHHFRATGALKHFEKLISGSPDNCRWFGKGIEFLSPPTKVTIDSFRALIANRHPIDGKPLVTLQVDLEGKFTPLCTEIDITLTPSVELLLDQNLDIWDAHWYAAAAAMRHLEIYAAGPTERDGEPYNINTSNVVGISFESFKTFAGLRMPHVSYLLFSLTYDEDDKQWLMLNPDEIAVECEYATERYLSELCPGWWDRELEVTENINDAAEWDSCYYLN